MLDYDRLAVEFARHRLARPEVVEGLAAGAGLKPGSRVLEVGCGTGNYMAALDRVAGCECWGIDPSGEMLSVAMARPGGASLGFGRAERLDFPGGYFSLVFSVDVIHYVDDRSAYFQEAFRVLDEGGRLCTVTDSEWNIRNRQPLAEYFPETVDVDLARYPAIGGLRDAMERAGFSAVQEQAVEFSYESTDIHLYRDKAFSCLHLIPEEAFRRGIECMERDLRRGPIRCVSRYLLLWGMKQTGGRATRAARSGTRAELD